MIGIALRIVHNLELIIHILKVHRDGNAIDRTLVGIASMNGPAMVEADLSPFEGHRHGTNLLTRGLDFREKCIEILGLELTQFSVFGPAMTAIEHDKRSHVDRAILQRNPAGHHFVGGTKATKR